MDASQRQRQIHLQQQLSHTIDRINETHKVFVNDLSTEDKKQIQKSQAERLLHMFKIQQLCQRKKYLEEQLVLNMQADQIEELKQEVDKMKKIDENTNTLSNYFYYSSYGKKTQTPEEPNEAILKMSLKERYLAALGNSESAFDNVSDVYITDRFSTAYSKIGNNPTVLQSLLY